MIAAGLCNSESHSGLCCRSNQHLDVNKGISLQFSSIFLGIRLYCFHFPFKKLNLTKDFNTWFGAMYGLTDFPNAYLQARNWCGVVAWEPRHAKRDLQTWLMALTSSCSVTRFSSVCVKHCPLMESFHAVQAKFPATVIIDIAAIRWQLVSAVDDPHFLWIADTFILLWVWANWIPEVPTYP